MRIYRSEEAFVWDSIKSLLTCVDNQPINYEKWHFNPTSFVGFQS